MGKYIIFASIGFELVGLVLGSYYLGNYLDQTYQTKGMIFVGLAFASIIGWLVRVLWLIKKLQKDEEQ